jgi:hypothetical protein
VENELRQSIEYYKIKFYPQYVDIIIVSKIVFVEDSHMEGDVRSRSSGMMLFIVMKNFEDPRLDSSNSREIWRELDHGFRSTAATMASSLPGVRTACGRSTFTYAAGVKPSISKRLCSGRQNKLASG